MSKSIEERFSEFTEKYPIWSSYLCFATSLRKGDKNIRQNFEKLVDKEDYAHNEKEDILSYLFTISKK